MSWDITSLYFLVKFCINEQNELSTNGAYQNTDLVVESLKFCTLIGFFGPNQKYSTEKSTKKYRRVISHDTEEWCKV